MGNKGIDPVKEQKIKQRLFLPRTLMTASLHVVTETGTELCPLHHIRQCLKRYDQSAKAPIPSQHYAPTGN